jgi:hypothetical protein
MDAEIEAMAVISTALGNLDPDATRRVLKWAIERYQPRQTATPGPVEAAFDPSEPSQAPQRTYLNLPELFDAANAENGLDRALVVAYWFQVLQGERDGWDSQKINTELKHLGHPSSNITRDLDNLMSKTPRYVMQMRKHGTSRQARKLYALTREGMRAVETMLGRTEPLAG